MTERDCSLRYKDKSSSSSGAIAAANRPCETAYYAELILDIVPRLITYTESEVSRCRTMICTDPRDRHKKLCDSVSPQRRCAQLDGREDQFDGRVQPIITCFVSAAVVVFGK